MIKIKRAGKYDRMLYEVVKESPELLPVIKEKTRLFSNNPLDTRLENHALRRRMAGKFAFSITDDTRIVYEWLGKNSVRFLAIGKHRQVYGGSS